jgi:hypothetical protein
MTQSLDEFASTVLESVQITATKLLDSDTADKVVDTVENTMLPYLVAAGSFVYGVVFPENQGKIESPTTAVVPANSGKGSVGMTFFYGACESKKLYVRHNPMQYESTRFSILS